MRKILVPAVLAVACAACSSTPPAMTLDKADMSDAEKLAIYCSEDAALYLGFFDKTYTPDVACPSDQLAELDLAYKSGVNKRQMQEQMLIERQNRLEQGTIRNMESAPTYNNDSNRNQSPPPENSAPRVQSSPSRS